MNREKCINRNITIASAIISGVNILTFYNAFYKCFKFKYVDDFISLLCCKRKIIRRIATN